MEAVQAMQFQDQSLPYCLGSALKPVAIRGVGRSSSSKRNAHFLLCPFLWLTPANILYVKEIAG
ncbi:hypothetical protein GO001_23505 [Streptomyces sp. NRRL B-1677]|uniref:hypothetical protein n=1 Tax=Streptomyces sp. NRRL B-1677 TaxID=2682966 RepID=UPI001892C715|nr:hypothetical protein [Streptomyces sp. NRRL B-1677]MBF6048144.1 hypothetical protein [Streptomyces sp. NRRL B-1677]